MLWFLFALITHYLLRVCVCVRGKISTVAVIVCNRHGWSCGVVEMLEADLAVKGRAGSQKGARLPPVRLSKGSAGPVGSLRRGMFEKDILARQKESKKRRENKERKTILKRTPCTI